jgi:hypothetical protein
MKMAPRDVLDVSVVLGGLLVSSIAIGTVDYFETGRMMAGATHLNPWLSDDAPMTSLDRSYLIVRGSVIRWLCVHLPSLALLLGAVVGVACSGWRRAWLVAAVALSPLPVMAVAFLIDVPLAAIFFASLHLLIAVLSATAAGYWLNRIKGG